MNRWISLSVFSSFLLCQVTYGADINYLRSVITDHFSDNRNHEFNNAYKTASKEYIYQEFKKNGLETEYHNFTQYGSGPGFANVVGIMRGANFGTAKDKIVGLGAHYDTVKNTKGVDDNGSGVAAMLEVVRQLGAQNKNGVKRSNTVVFVSFDLEEYNYTGSSVFIQEWLNPWLLKNYGNSSASLAPHGIIVLDTIMEYSTAVRSQQFPDGAEKAFQTVFPQSVQSISSDSFRGDFLAMIYRATPDASLASSLRNSWSTAARPQFKFESFALPFADVTALNRTVRHVFGIFLKSDHFRFWAKNIPAIFLSDTADLRGANVQCYHNTCDDLNTMLTDDNINFLGKTSDSLAISIHELSQPLSTGTSSFEKSTNSFIMLMVLMCVGSILRE